MAKRKRQENGIPTLAAVLQNVHCGKHVECHCGKDCHSKFDALEAFYDIQEALKGHGDVTDALATAQRAIDALESGVS